MKATLAIGLIYLAALPGSAARADDFPSFKTDPDKATKEFVAEVGTVIVKAARSRPQEIELDRYEYSKLKKGRYELTIKMNYTGPISKKLRKTHTATIKMKIDTTDMDKWEVLTIEYKDNNKVSLLKHNDVKVQKLIPRFNE